MNQRLKGLCAEHLPFALSAPAFLWQAYFLFIPLAFITGYSLVPDVGVEGSALTLRHYAHLFDWDFFKIVFNSGMLAFITSVLCLILAFPVAYYLAIKARRWRNVLLVFLILPSWTSFIIQIYSWFYLLQKHGLFSSFLYRMGWTSEPVSLLNNYGATVLGMTYCFLPFMVLPLYTVLARMDSRLLEASADLGANRWQTVRKIVLPLSSSGIKVGMALVMVPAFGEFAIPDLMGGVKDVYVGRMIMEKFLIFRDWHSGSAVVMASFFIPLVVVACGYMLRVAGHRVARRRV